MMILPTAASYSFSLKALVLESRRAKKRKRKRIEFVRSLHRLVIAVHLQCKILAVTFIKGFEIFQQISLSLF